MADRRDTLLICCGAIAREIVTLVKENGWEHMHVECLPASIHNAPNRIPEAVRVKIRVYTPTACSKWRSPAGPHKTRAAPRSFSAARLFVSAKT